jgi:hypothetical protein
MSFFNRCWSGQAPPRQRTHFRWKWSWVDAHPQPEKYRSAEKSSKPTGVIQSKPIKGRGNPKKPRAGARGFFDSGSLTRRNVTGLGRHHRHSPYAHRLVCSFCPSAKEEARLSAGNALATTVTTRTDPTWGTTAATSISPTCRQFDDRGCVLERMDAGSSVLRARLQGHCPQYERRCRQRHHEFSHKDPPSLQDYQNGEKHAQYIPFLEPRRAFCYRLIQG